MQGYFAVGLIVLLMGTVIVRVLLLRRIGIDALHFGRTHKSDFLIPPFALFYFYSLFAAAFGWPSLSTQRLFESKAAAWAGVGLCLLGWAALVWSILSFGRSFRVGIDAERPDRLITTGVFAISRNPIYVGFWLFLFGQFLIFPGWIPLIALGAATWLFHRQVLREEVFLRQHYGADYEAYCQRVRRYL